MTLTMDEITLNDEVWNLFNEPNLDLNEDTLSVYDIKPFSEDQKYEEFPKLEEKLGPPARGDFIGDYNFGIIIEHNTRNKYEYSENLKKVYINLSTELPVQFTWDWMKVKEHHFGGFMIRATLQFAEKANAERRPFRCLNHISPQDAINIDIPSTMRAHILQSVLKHGDGGVLYCGNTENERSWLSVCVRAPETLSPGVSMFSHTYKFMCKNSCASGINRHPIEVAFTLENSIGEVLGRQTIGVRVCSCPKRDMAKDERSSGLAPQAKIPRLSTAIHTNAPSNKIVIKAPNIDLTPCNMNFTILGKKNAEKILHFAMALMQADANQLHLLVKDPGQTPHDTAINAISKHLRQP